MLWAKLLAMPSLQIDPWYIDAKAAMTNCFVGNDSSEEFRCLLILF
jgi:hypothetical protein